MATSRSSSSSVRNPYGSISNGYKATRNYSSEYDVVKCKCDLPSPCQEAWKEGTLDPGRRFYGCIRYRDPKKRYNFFVWADPPYSERAREVIQSLKMELMRKEDELQNVKADISFMERKMLVLDEEVGMLRKKIEDAKIDGAKMEGSVTVKKLLVVCVVVFILFLLGLFKGL